MFSIEHFGQVADITHSYCFSFLKTMELVPQIEATFKGRETENPTIFCIHAACYTASHVLINFNTRGRLKSYTIYFV